MATKLEHGDSVKIKSPHPLSPTDTTGNAFEGKTGTIVGEDRDGSRKMYRVSLDTPVKIPLGDGSTMTVTDDIWSRDYLRKMRG